MQSWDRVLNVNQVGSHRRLGLVGNLDIVCVESSGYWFRNALNVGRWSPDSEWCVLRLVGELWFCLSLDDLLVWWSCQDTRCPETFCRGRRFRPSVLKGCCCAYKNEKKSLFFCPKREKKYVNVKNDSKNKKTFFVYVGIKRCFTIHMCCLDSFWLI